MEVVITGDSLSNRRTQPPEVFYKKGVLKSFVKFTGKHLYHSLFFDKVAGLRLEQVFSCNFAKLLRTPVLQNTVSE